MSADKNYEHDDSSASSMKRSADSDDDTSSPDSELKRVKTVRDENEPSTANANNEDESVNVDENDTNRPRTSNSRGNNNNSNNNNNSGRNPALRRWQSKQLAQSIIDNAINKVLGDLSNSSSDHMNLSILTPQIIESAGVAVAFRQRGLQRRHYMAAMAAESTVNQVDTRATQLGTDSENHMPIESADDLLNQAISCAISRKGLASVSSD